MFVNLKNNCMFAVFNAKERKTDIIGNGIFYALILAVISANIRGCQTPLCGLPYRKVSKCSLARTEGDSLSYFQLPNNFHSQMPKTMEITQSVKHSNTIRTPHSATTVSTLSFSEILSEVEKRFAVEKDCKNEAYAFILAMGLIEEFKAFSAQTKQVKDKHSQSLVYNL